MSRCVYCLVLLDKNNCSYQDDVCDECFEDLCDEEIEKGNVE